jgi:hypothetical protein
VVATPFVEADCTVTLGGKEFTAGGAEVTDDHCIAYLGKDWELHSWHGEVIGSYRVIRSWRTPNSYVSSRMCQVEAVVNGIVYTGRSAGQGMIFKGKRKAGQQSDAVREG